MENAVWLYTGSECRTEAEMDSFVEWAVSNNVKRVLLHMDERQANPESADYERASKLIMKCMDAKLEVHGMISALLTYTPERSSLPLQDKDCYCVDYHGISNWDEPVCGRGYLFDPLSPKVRDRVPEMCCRLLAAFPGLAGIHLDFIRYYYYDSRLNINTKNAGHWVLMPRQGSPIKFEMEDGSKITYFIEEARNRYYDPPIGDIVRLRRYYNYCFCDRCVKAFLEKIPQAAAEVPESDRAKWILDNYPDEWAAFHAECITDLVRLIRKRIKDCRSDVQLSAAIWYNAPYGNELRQEPLEDESESRCFGQKWWEWVDEGLVDFLCPMDYWLLPETFRSVVSGQLKKVNGKVPLYIGLLKSREFEISVEQNKKYNIIASEAGASGICYFSYSTWK